MYIAADVIMGGKVYRVGADVTRRPDRTVCVGEPDILSGDETSLPEGWSDTVIKELSQTYLDCPEHFRILDERSRDDE